MAALFTLLYALLLYTAHYVQARPTSQNVQPHEFGQPHPQAVAASSCFPAVGFSMPSAPPADTTNWWCDPSTEYAFVGFSYEVTACQSAQQLQKEFADIRSRFKSRYVRLYGACDNDGFYDDIVDAAWSNGLGVHALVWFGFDGDDVWKTRRDTLFAALHANKKAKFVTRVVQFGSEPLYDDVLPHQQLAEQVTLAKANLSSLSIPVTVSELAYGYQERDGAQDVLDAIDSVNIHMLPFFDQNASTANASWPIVLKSLDFFIKNGGGKKMYFDENGWPSVTSSSVQPNSPNAVSDVPNERAYYELLDSKCEYLKAVEGGGVGWFAHIYSDDMEPGYGIYDSSGHLKFPFQPRTSC
ncbi:glycoside hydrolase superfamily [Amylocystis lapponica]|nr:glycoside hydrolase superfamily [Amylocystis lapponica]